jgi:hypothetical protein
MLWTPSGPLSRVLRALQLALLYIAGSSIAHAARATPTPVWPAPQADNVAPQFSWDTMGGMVFMQLCNPIATLDSPGYPTTVMRTLSRFPLVTVRAQATLVEESCNAFL